MKRALPVLFAGAVVALGFTITSSQAEAQGKPAAWVVYCQIEGKTGPIVFGDVVKNASEIPYLISKCQAEGGHPAGVRPVREARHPGK